MKTRVVHVNSDEWRESVKAGNAVYIGRAVRRAKDPLCRVASRWANPLKVGRDGTKQQVIAHYYFRLEREDGAK